MTFQVLASYNAFLYHFILLYIGCDVYKQKKVLRCFQILAVLLSFNLSGVDAINGVSVEDDVHVPCVGMSLCIDQPNEHCFIWKTCGS